MHNLMLVMMMKHRLPYFLILLILLYAAPQAFGDHPEPVSCSDHSIVASAVQTPKDVEVFVQCAYEFVQEMGFEEARRAFHEDERWRSGPTYIFVDEMASDARRRRVNPGSSGVSVMSSRRCMSVSSA